MLMHPRWIQKNVKTHFETRTRLKFEMTNIAVERLVAGIGVCRRKMPTHHQFAFERRRTNVAAERRDVVSIVKRRFVTLQRFGIEKRRVANVARRKVGIRTVNCHQMICLQFK
jgi:hypothetical protein